MTTDELELLARADPAPAGSGPWSDRPLDGRARQDLELLREHGPLQALVRRRWLLSLLRTRIVFSGLGHCLLMVERLWRARVVCLVSARWNSGDRG